MVKFIIKSILEFFDDNLIVIYSGSSRVLTEQLRMLIVQLLNISVTGLRLFINCGVWIRQNNVKQHKYTIINFAYYISCF